MPNIASVGSVITSSTECSLWIAYSFDEEFRTLGDGEGAAVSFLNERGGEQELKEGKKQLRCGPYF